MTTFEQMLAWHRHAAGGDDDLLLIARCLDGEEAAFTDLYLRHAAYIFRLCYGLLGNREDAEEVLQDAFSYAFRRLADYDADKAAFKTWLYQIAVSRCRNKRRRKWLPTLSLSQLTGDSLPDEGRPGPDEALALTGRQQAIWSALRQLSPKLRETAVLRYYEGLTYVEIGAILDIPPKTAESRMRLAHNALKSLLADGVDGNPDSDGRDAGVVATRDAPANER